MVCYDSKMDNDNVCDKVPNAEDKSTDYIMHIQYLFDEYQKLQLNFARFRSVERDQRNVKNGFHNPSQEDSNKSLNDYKVELENERTLTVSLKTEIKYLSEEVKKFQNVYTDLINKRFSQVDTSTIGKNDFILCNN